MSGDAMWLVLNLLRTTVLLTAAALAALALLRLARPAWTAAHRAAWLLVLLVGWTFWQWPLAVPWHDPSAAASPQEPERSTAALALPAPALPPADLEGDLEVVELKPADAADAPAITLEPAAAPATTQFVELKPAGPPAPAAAPALAPPFAETAPAFDRNIWAVAIVAAWLVGMALIVAAWLWGYLGFVRVLRSRRPAGDEWQREWAAVAADAGLARWFPLTLNDHYGPMLCRLPRGYELVVPEGLWRALDAPARRAILRHELAHYQRGDVWKALVVRLLALPHWFNPLAWLAVRRFEEAAEWACDRAATADVPATEYAKVLIGLGQLPPSYGYGSAARGRSLAARVRRVLAGEPPQDSALKKALLVAAAACLVGLSVVQVRLVAREPATDNGAQAKSDEEPAGTIELKQPADSSTPADNSIRALQEKMVKQAEESFYRHKAAWEAGTIMMPSVYEWSLRWMQAAETLATQRDAKIAAAAAHVERMRQLQKHCELLDRVGTRGDEKKDHAAANYYLSEAERQLAELKAGEKAAAKKVNPAGEVRDPVAPGIPFESQTPKPLDKDLPQAAAAQKRMLEEAKKAYEAHVAAYDALTVRMPSVYEWSLRWMQAAQALAKDRAARVQAAQDHVERMRNLQQKIEVLFKSGTQGGEANEYFAANYYLAEAERELAQLEGQGNARPPAPSLQPAARSQLDAVDLEIKIADFQSQLEQVAVQIETKRKDIDLLQEEVNVASRAGAISELNKARGELKGLELQKRSLEQQLKLHEQKLKLIKTLSAAPAETFETTPTTPTAPARGQASPAGQRTLLYDGRDLDAWADDLRNDLSPEQRTKAIKALATFAANGYGKIAAQEIVNAMQGYSIWMRDNSPVGQLKEAALAAFRPSALDPATIPPDDARPVLLEALKSRHANQRLFALEVLPAVMPKREEKVATIAPLVKDPDELVRRYAADLLIALAPETPGIADVLREALGQQDKSTQRWCQAAIGKLLALAGSGEPAADAANKVLDDLGPDTLHPVLQQLVAPNTTNFVFGMNETATTIKEQAEKRLRTLK